MRKMIGFTMAIMAIPIFIYSSTKLSAEWNKAASVDQYIESRIQVSDFSLPAVSYITDSKGNIISEITNGQKRIILAPKDIPKLLKDAFVVTEDRNFFEHPGVDLFAIGRAIAANHKSNEIKQGASTITQQLARHLFLNQEKTYNRKLAELLYSYEIEKNFSKEDILGMYINAIYFGNGAYGIEAASQTYFGKTASGISDAELLFLSAIPNNPTLYNPSIHFSETKERQERIIDQLVDNLKLSPAQGEKLKGEPVTLNKTERIDKFPDYVTYVEKELRMLVAQKENLSRELLSGDASIQNAAEIRLDQTIAQLLASGVTVHTALDRNIQAEAKSALRASLPHKGVEGSTVVIQHHTHELVSLTGSKEYKKKSFHRGFQSYRQPGSAIKPLLVYAPYLDMTNAGINQPIDGSPFCKEGYCPGNFGERIYGQTSLKEAFKHSYNTSAVRLLDLNGLEKSFAYLELFHFQKVTEDDYRLPSAIGGFTYGMSPLELTGAYSSFYDGSYTEPRSIRKVTDAAGNILYEWDRRSIQVWQPKTAEKMKVLLNSVIEEGTGRKAKFQSRGYLGGKTGTTNQFHDLWFVGLTDRYTAGVWVGKDVPASIESLGSPHMDIWKKIMQTTEKERHPES